MVPRDQWPKELQELTDVGANVYSQFGEDGFIDKIFEVLGTDNKWCLEVGASDGTFCSNTRHLIDKGWAAILIESDPDAFARIPIVKNTHRFNKTVSISGEDSLDEIMLSCGAPRDIDFVSIDIDGQDYHIFNSMVKYRPRVVIVEHAALNEDHDFIPAIGGQGQAGKNAIVKLLSSRFYTAIIQTDSNTIAVRGDVLTSKSLKKTATKGGPLRLNLGSGDKPIEGDDWRNVDRKGGTEVYPLGIYESPEEDGGLLPMEDNSVDEIRASHILEHFPRAESGKVIKHWVDKLKTGGVLKIAVPDMKKICEGYRAGSDMDIAGYLLGGQTDEDDYHKSVFDQASLARLMGAVGLIDIKPWKSEHDDCAALKISLNLMGTKGEAMQIKSNTIKAVISMPRLCFSANMFSAIKGLLPYHIELIKGVGVFWDQVLCRLVQKQLDAGAEIIITFDYDTWFTEAHIMAMLRLLCKYPEIDALCPAQVKRESEELLVGTLTEAGEPVAGIGDNDFSNETSLVLTGHFGMTFFRASALRKAKKPWMVGVPNKQGEWGEGRQDPDIYFWNNWRASGLKLYQANNVPIGHLQQVCTFPDTPENKFKPIHVYMQDLEMGRIPEHCIL